MSEKPTSCPNCGAFAGDWGKIGGPRHQGQDEATSTLAVIAQIREVTGLGHRPMLSELAQAVADVIAAKSLDRSALISHDRRVHPVHR